MIPRYTCWIAAGILSASLVTACGGEGREGDNPRPADPSRRTLQDHTLADLADTVRSWSELPRAERRSAALSLAVRLPAGYLTKERRDFGELAEALVREGMAELVAYLDETLPGVPDGAMKQRVLHGALVDVPPEAGWAVALRSELAGRYSESLPLAPFRPAGLSYLLSVVEDQGNDVVDRVAAVGLLGRFGSHEALAGLTKLQDDTTPYSLGCGDLPYPAVLVSETLGGFVREAIDEIRSRLPR